MATLKDLPNISILEMDSEELFAHFKEIRASRKVPKKVAKSPSKRAEKPKTADQLIGMLSPEMAEELLKRVEGG